MSFEDNGDDELDYEDEDYTEPGQPYADAAATGAIAALVEDEMEEEEEDYEDLYDDVDVNFFENPEGVDAQEPGGFPDGVEENGEEEYAGENYGEEYERGAENPEDDAYVEEEQAYDDAAQAGLPEGAEDGDYDRPEDYVDEEILEDAPGQPVKEEAGDGVDIPEGATVAADASADLLQPKQEFAVANRLPDSGNRAPSVSTASQPVAVKSEEKALGEEDVQGAKAGATAVVPAPKPKAEDISTGVSQARVETQGGKAVADRVGKGPGWANGSVPSTGSDGAGAAARTAVQKDGARGGGGSGAPTSSGAGAAAPIVTREGGAGANDFAAKHGSSNQHESGGIMLFVGELHWWTTDAELEAALSDFGRVKNLKFFEEKASGRSKGYCQVEFYDAGAARACKEKMDGRSFHDKPCVVAFASPQTIKQMGAAQVGKNQSQSHGSAGGGGGGPARGKGGESGSSARAGASGSQMGDGGRDGGRNYGREKMPMSGGRGGPPDRGRSSGRSRGGGGNMGGRGGGGAHFGQGPPGPMGGVPGGMMPPQGMLGGGFDPAFGPGPMGRGGGYGMGPGGPAGNFGPRAHPFGGPGMGPPFPNMGPGLPGVAPHVNPAFFGRANGNGPGIGMDGPAGAWGDGPMPGWAEEHERRMVYGDELGGPDFGYPGDMGPDRMRGGPVRDRDRMGEGDWPGVDRRRREDRPDEWGGERHRDRGARDDFWEREQGRDKEKDWQERERLPRGREKGRGVGVDEEERPRSRDEEFGKRRRMVADRKIER